MDARVSLFGIRHHGPGSAASLVQALDALDPAYVLIEGPPEASDIIGLVTAPGMRPPLAILTHPANSAEQARFHPFAEYSPEWQAMRWATLHARPVEFIDEPLLPRPEPDADTASEANAPDDDETGDEAATEVQVRRDPLSHLAQSAGHSDGEAWWNALIEQHVHAPDVFAAIERAMTALRDAVPDDTRTDPESDRDLRREAFMRIAIRKALKACDGPIAVVCGAWHVPALRAKTSASADRALVKGLRPARAVACWVPWTDSRLAALSGYGAGVISPAWYRHLWGRFGTERNAVEAVAEWQAHAARLLRTEGLPAATSSVIDATRLAVTLAAVRTLPVPGLTEMRDASLAALCHGDDIALRVIERRLVIGERVGEVDESAPQPPLLADLTRQQKKLRLKPEGFPKEIALDLRSTAGLAKSVLLHRLALIGVNWGQLLDASAGRGTFREIWTIEWQPELAVALAEAVVHGPTVARAADGAAIERSNTETDCAKLAELVRQCLLADLGTAANASIVRLQGVAVQAGDVFALARAVVPLVDILRYGTAREMPTGALTQLVTSIVVDICSGLRYACHGLDETAAGEARMALADLNRAVTLLSDEHVLGQWQRALESCANDTRVAALLRGFAVRLLYDASRLDADAAAAALSLALSPSVRIADAGAWFEGFLNDAGDIIVVDTALFRIVDEWIVRQTDETFVELLPLLRRAFSSFDSAIRQRLLERVRGGGGDALALDSDDPRAATAFANAAPLLLAVLGRGEA